MEVMKIIETIVMWATVSFSVGLLYVLFSLGLTLIFGFHEVVNFAHGAFYMLGGFIGLFFYTISDNYAIALISSVIVTMALAALTERFLISRLYGTAPANNFLLTFAFGFVLIGFVKLIAGSGIRNFPVPKALNWSLTIGTFNIAAYRIFFIVFAAIVVFLIYLLLTKTMMGIIIRAGTANRPAVEVLGINVKNYFTILFAMGSGLAALSAVLAAPLLSVYPSMGDEIILWAFVIVIIGGIGSLKGAVIAGLLIGLLHGLGSIYLGPMSMVLTFCFFIVLLFLKPEGLFGYRITQ